MLSRSQRKMLHDLSPEWQDTDSEWKASIVFLRLEAQDLVDMRFNRNDRSDVSCGPGAHVSGIWQIRRTEKGTAALDNR